MGQHQALAHSSSQPDSGTEEAAGTTTLQPAESSQCHLKPQSRQQQQQEEPLQRYEKSSEQSHVEPSHPHACQHAQPSPEGAEGYQPTVLAQPSAPQLDKYEEETQESMAYHTQDLLSVEEDDFMHRPPIQPMLIQSEVQQQASHNKLLSRKGAPHSDEARAAPKLQYQGAVADDPGTVQLSNQPSPGYTRQDGVYMAVTPDRGALSDQSIIPCEPKPSPHPDSLSESDFVDMEAQQASDAKQEQDAAQCVSSDQESGMDGVAEMNEQPEEGKTPLVEIEGFGQELSSQ